MSTGRLSKKKGFRTFLPHCQEYEIIEKENGKNKKTKKKSEGASKKGQGSIKDNNETRLCTKVIAIIDIF